MPERDQSNPLVTLFLAAIAACGGVFLALHFEQGERQGAIDLDGAAGGPPAIVDRPAGSDATPPRRRAPGSSGSGRTPPPARGSETAPPTKPPTRIVTPPARPPVDIVETMKVIDGLVRAFRLEKSLEELRKVAALPLTDADRARVKARISRVESYLGLLDRLAAGIQSGPLKGYPLTWPGLGRVLRLTGADRAGFHARLGRKKDAGSVGEKWANLPVRVRWNMFQLLKLSADESWTLSALFADLDDAALAERSLIRVWLSEKDQRQRVSDRVAELRGTRAPAGGFVAYRRAFVTPTEKANLSRGLVLEGDQWVTRADQRHMRKGHQKIGGKWVPLTAEELRARGYIKYKGQWVTRSKLTQTRSVWKDAWERKTAHFLLRTNHSEQFADHTAVALESAYAAMVRHFGTRPKGTSPLRVLGFRTYEDYRDYCTRIGKTGMLNAAGFSPSEKRTCCGWDSGKNRRSFLRTLVHESCHLFYQESTGGRVPSWLAEGMATYFEGFEADGKGNLRFDHKPRGRKRALQSILGTANELTFEELVTLRAGQLINSDAQKASAFYATSWGYYYFFHHVPDARYRKGFAAFGKAGRRSTPDPTKVFGRTYAQLHADFVRFIKKQ